MSNRIEPDKEGHNNWNDSNVEKVFDWLFDGDSPKGCLIGIVIFIILCLVGVIS